MLQSILATRVVGEVTRSPAQAAAAARAIARTGRPSRSPEDAREVADAIASLTRGAGVPQRNASCERCGQEHEIPYCPPPRISAQPYTLSLPSRTWVQIDTSAVGEVVIRPRSGSPTAELVASPGYPARDITPGSAIPTTTLVEGYRSDGPFLRLPFGGLWSLYWDGGTTTEFILFPTYGQRDLGLGYPEAGATKAPVNTQFTVTNAAVDIFAANANAKLRVISSNGPAVVYLGFGVDATSGNWGLLAGKDVTLTGRYLIRTRISAITAAPGDIAQLGVLELV